MRSSRGATSVTLVVVSDDETECKIGDRHPVDQMIGQAHHVNGRMLGPPMPELIESAANMGDAHFVHDRGHRILFRHQISQVLCVVIAPVVREKKGLGRRKSSWYDEAPWLPHL
jgi:hypothetical protein